MGQSTISLVSIITGATILAALNISYSVEWKNTRENLESQERKLGVPTAYSRALEIISSNNPLERKILFYGNYKAALDYRKTIDKLFY